MRVLIIFMLSTHRRSLRNLRIQTITCVIIARIISNDFVSIVIAVAGAAILAMLAMHAVLAITVCCFVS